MNNTRRGGKMTVLVTGGGGMIGARIARHLLDQGEQVVSMDTAASQPRLEAHSDNPNLDCVGCDVREYDDILDVMKSHAVSHVIHMAALLVPLTEEEPALGLSVNVGGTNNIFEAARHSGITRVVYPTSMSVYGDQSEYGGGSVDETSLRSPYSLYGYAKLMNEEVAQAYTRNFDLDTRGLRIASVFGHGRVTGRSGSISKIISYAAVGEPVTSALPADQVTPVVHVDDVAASMVRLCFAETLELPVYVGGNVKASVRDVVDIVKEYASSAEIDFEPGAVPYTVIQNMDCSRIEHAIGYSLPPLRQRILEQMNEARQERQMPPLG
jgi:nucleoside-diphosphate-sugar epimerase